MSAPDLDRNVMRSFEALTGDTHLTVVLGAGASAPSGLPTWDEFAIRLAVRSGLVASGDAARMLLEKQDPTIVLEAAHARSGASWAAFLNEALYGLPPRDAEPSPLHLAAAGHYSAMPNSTTLATLNFDDLLETAALSNGAPLVVMDTEGPACPLFITFMERCTTATNIPLSSVTTTSRNSSPTLMRGSEISCRRHSRVARYSLRVRHIVIQIYVIGCI
ncbi:hypothetical protein GCM10022240_04180 [Microbacterium kribbense]|uniref:SIR2-like domain-containing protein n=1 Tax=Microbacterium kribbense TaxID=433645 RepID=A0ABP7G8T6_9MICO